MSFCHSSHVLPRFLRDRINTIGPVVRIFAVTGALLAAVAMRAGTVEDAIAIHTEAIGGREQITALKAMRATGTVISAGKRIRFTLIAARPDKLRLETVNGGRSLVQVSDGLAAPWEFDTGDWPPRPRDLAPPAARLFAADAEFDDPLVAGESRGFSFDYAGELVADGKRLIRILVTRKLRDTFSVFLDAETYLIVARSEQRPNPLGGTHQIVTQFDQYRPVAGVLVPHRVTLLVDGKLRQETLIESVSANPQITDETFSRPLGITVPQRTTG